MLQEAIKQDIKKVRTQDLGKYLSKTDYTLLMHELEHQSSILLHENFNFIHLNVVEKCLMDDIFGYIWRPQFDGDNFDINDEETQKELENHYPTWHTLFEVRDSSLIDPLLIKHKEDLYKLGLGLMYDNEYFNVMLFPTGDRRDFYKSYWIPLFRDILGWIK